MKNLDTFGVFFLINFHIWYFLKLIFKSSTIMTLIYLKHHQTLDSLSVVWVQMVLIILNQLWIIRLIFLMSLLQNPRPVKNCQNTSSWLLCKVSVLLLQRASFSFISCYAPLANLSAEFQFCNLWFWWQLAK